MEGKWLSILEYANFKNKSISTVRRYIKANRVKHKEENGKYFIFCKNYFDSNVDQETTELKLENLKLKKDLVRLTDELNELKMLVQLYESGQMITNKAKLPELPAHI